MHANDQAADFVVVGGGTAGLVVANRLSEDPNVSVVVIESGSDKTYDKDIQNPDNWQNVMGAEYAFKYETTPQTDVNSRVFGQEQGRALGGGSTINQAVFVAPSRSAINAWAKLGNPNWTFEHLYPFLNKAHTFHQADKESLAAVGIQQTQSNGDIKHANGTSPPSGPIQVSLPAISQRHPMLKAWNEAFTDMGYATVSQLTSGDSVGSYCYSAAIDPKTGVRSAAALEYGVPASKRPNVTIMTKTSVQKIVLTGKAPNAVASGVQVASSSGQVITIKAKKEVILAAGAYNSPKMLELSGIGDSTRLTDLGIPVVVNNPSVGENLQNHVLGGFPVELKEDVKVGDGFQGLTFIPLNDFTGSAKETERKAFWSKLLDAHPSSPEHKAYHDAIRNIYENQDQASASLFFAFIGLPSLIYAGAMCTIPFSRGTTHVTSANLTDATSAPCIDPRFLSHPADIEIMARQLVSVINVCTNSPTFSRFTKPPALAPDLDAAKTFIRENMSVAYHPCGTAVMRPESDGGVVDQTLLVYGTKNLRVVDASIFPLLPQGNPMATVYAVAERAADMIKHHHAIV